MDFKWVTTSQKRSMPLPPHTCHASNVTWTESNPMSYSMSGDLHGRCTVIFRQSFSPIWAISVASGTASVRDHLQVDAFANGWIVDGSGPVTFHIINRALYPYVAGMALTLVTILLALGSAAASRIRAAATRRASRAPSPA